MAAYVPFLLPLAGVHAGPQAAACRPPGGPLDEEAALLRLPAGARPGWRDLAERARAEYGLPLLTEEMPGARVRAPEAALGQPSPQRWLAVEDAEAGCHWFVLEHPCALHCHDRHGRAGQRAALARPSLFAHWLALAAGGQAAENGRPGAADASLAAFHHFISGLVRRGQPSDWHLEPRRDGCLSRLRIDGVMTEGEMLPDGRGRWLVDSVISCAGLGGRPAGAPLEGGFTVPADGAGEVRLRVSLVPALHGHALAVRFLYPDSGAHARLEQLGLTPPQAELLRGLYAERDGLWLVAGPTGAGKSTTLHALLRLSVAAGEKALAIEDPVERRIPGVQQLQVGSPPGLGFARAMRAFLRQAPDCLLVGEIRDAETAAIALQAARTGHRVLSSIHARDRAGVRRRFADLGQDDVQTGPVIRVQLHQRLVPVLCADCRIEAPLPTGLRAVLQGLLTELPETVHAAHGCPLCHGGHRGRTGVFAVVTGEKDTPDHLRLLESACHHLAAGRIGPAALEPFLPGEPLREIHLCHT